MSAYYCFICSPIRMHKYIGRECGNQNTQVRRIERVEGHTTFIAYDTKLLIVAHAFSLHLAIGFECIYCRAFLSEFVYHKNRFTLSYFHINWSILITKNINATIFISELQNNKINLFFTVCACNLYFVR